MSTSNVISIEEFEGEYAVKQMGGGENWHRCRVIGVADEGAWSNGRFIIITEDEGALFAGRAEKVRHILE